MFALFLEKSFLSQSCEDLVLNQCLFINEV
jgi:hypothetical protein